MNNVMTMKRISTILVVAAVVALSISALALTLLPTTSPVQARCKLPNGNHFPAQGQEHANENGADNANSKCPGSLAGGPNG